MTDLYLCPCTILTPIIFKFWYFTHQTNDLQICIISYRTKVKLQSIFIKNNTKILFSLKTLIYAYIVVSHFSLIKLQWILNSPHPQID